VIEVPRYVVPEPPFPTDLKLDGTGGSPIAQRLVADAATLARYPDATPLEAAIAARHGVDPTRVIVTAGADEALDRACRTFLAPGRSIVLPSPTFEMLGRYARLAGANVVRPAWPGGAWPLQEVLASIDEATAVVAIVSPNNPTGAVAERAALARVAEAAPAVLVDLAYVDFAAADPTPFALSLPNAIVFRTFSKAWGLPALRVGYAIGPAEWIGALRAAGGPYPVAGPSLALVARWLEIGGADVEAFVARVRDERRELEALLGPRVEPSQANFVFARFEDAVHVRAELARRGIAVRIFPNDPALSGALRVTLPGEPRAFERVHRAFLEILS
jgi:histidinol-phosphate aminotransferase